MADESNIPHRKRGRPRRVVANGTRQYEVERSADIQSISGKLGSQIGAKLRHARLARGLTQQDLAQLTFSKSYVSAIEHGKIKPSLRALVYLAERLAVPLFYFLDEGSDDDNVPVGALGRQSGVRYDTVYGLAHADRLAEGQPAEALTLLQHIDTALLSPMQQLRRITLIAQISISLAQGVAARDAIRQGQKLAHEMGHAEAAYRLAGMEAELDARDGHPDAAIARYRELAQRVADGTIRDLSLRLVVLTNLGELLHKQGLHDEANQYLTLALQVAQDTSSLDRYADTMWQLGEDWQQAGKVTWAAYYVTRSLYLRDAANDICRVIDIHSNLAEISQQQGHRDVARQHLEAALDVAEQLRNPSQCASALRRLVRLLLENVQADSASVQQARAYADRCLEWAKKSADAETLGLALAATGMAQSFSDDPAFKHSYQQAITQLEQANATTSLGDTLYEYAQLLRQHGDDAAAGAYLQRAYLLHPF